MKMLYFRGKERSMKELHFWTTDLRTTYLSRDQLSADRFDQTRSGSTHILSFHVCPAIVGSNPSRPASLPSYSGTRDLTDFDAEIFCDLRRTPPPCHYHEENQRAAWLSNTTRNTNI